jgi:hypothetical protein
MTDWQADLTNGIENYIRNFEDASWYVEKMNAMYRERVHEEYDNALKKLRDAKEAVSAFVGVYVEESRR